MFTLEPLAIVLRRLSQQRLSRDNLDHPSHAVAWLGAVQAQEYGEVVWSLVERTRDATATDVDAALARGEIVRIHVLRPTWHLVSADDARWLLRLTRPRVHALNRYWYAKFELDNDVLIRGHAVLAQALGDGRPRTRAELAAVLRGAGIEASGLRLGYLLMHAELEELIGSGPRVGRQHTYALLDQRVPPGPADRLAGEEAENELVRRYFCSHGPATIADFTAWSSLTVGVARAATARLGNALAVETDGHGVAWYSDPTAPDPPPSTRAFLIPMYDETIVAYQDLRVVRAHPGARPIERAVLIGGRTVGTWKRTASVRHIHVDVNLFGDLEPGEQQALAEAVERFGQCFGVVADFTTSAF